MQTPVHYGIDLQNFTSVEAAKAAVKERFEKQYEEAQAKYIQEMNCF